MRLDPNRSLPQTMLALQQAERLHRRANPIGSEMSAQIRWVVAESLNCQALRDEALEDLSQLSTDTARQCVDEGQLTDAKQEEPLLVFARKLTRAAYTVTDEDVNLLVDQFGVDILVGVVHTVAFANFQARLCLAIGSGTGLGGDEVSCGEELELDVAERWAGSVNACKALAVPQAFRVRANPPSEWREQEFSQIETAMLLQQQRESRVPIPTDEQLSNLTDAQRQRSAAIIWSRISLAYQPELTSSWFQLMDAFHTESRMDSVFCNSLFLVVTRSNQCFY